MLTILSTSSTTMLLPYFSNIIPKISNDLQIEPIPPDNPRLIYSRIVLYLANIDMKPQDHRNPGARQLQLREITMLIQRHCPSARTLSSPSLLASSLRSLTLRDTQTPRNPVLISVRHATHGAQGRANGPKNGPGKRLGAKKTGGTQTPHFTYPLLAPPICITHSNFTKLTNDQCATPQTKK